MEFCGGYTFCCMFCLLRRRSIHFKVPAVAKEIKVCLGSLSYLLVLVTKYKKERKGGKRREDFLEISRVASQLTINCPWRRNCAVAAF